MQPITNQAQQTIAYHQQRLSAYVPLIVKALAKTYGLPLFGVFIANIALSVAFSSSPEIFSGFLGTLITVSVFFGVMIVGWRYAESRWHGRTLLVGYASISKTRRLLQNEIESLTPSDSRIQEGMSVYAQSVDEMIQMMHSYNMIPEIIEVD